MENYYQSIDVDEFAEWMLFKEKHPFTTKEIDKLDSILGTISINLEKEFLITFYKRSKKYNLAKFADDWFILDQHRKAWKCDGFRAVIKLLDNI